MGVAIAGLTFVLMLFGGIDFITALVTSIILLTFMSGVGWLQNQAEDNRDRFELWYALVIMAAFVILAIVLFNN